MMVNLIRAELLRVVSSRMLILVGLAGIALGCWAGVTQTGNARPIPADVITAAYEQYNLELTIHQQACIEEPLAAECVDPSSAPQLDWFVPTPDDFQMVATYTVDNTGPLGLVAVVVLVTFLVGSEFNTGAIATQLTFTPRRVPLVWAKAIVATLTGGAVMVWWMGIGFVMNVVSFLQARGAAEIVANNELGLLLARHVTLGLLAGLMSALLTIAVASTLRAWVVITTVLVVSSIWGASATDWPVAFLPTSNLTALMVGSYEAHTYTEAGEAITLWPPITYWMALLYAGVWAVFLGLWASVSFVRRDILK